MWRLYGGNARGICMVFSFKSQQNSVLKKIQYVAKEDDIIKRLNQLMLSLKDLNINFKGVTTLKAHANTDPKELSLKIIEGKIYIHGTGLDYPTITQMLGQAQLHFMNKTMELASANPDDKFKKKQDDILSPVEKDFIQSIDKLEQIGKNKQS